MTEALPLVTTRSYPKVATFLAADSSGEEDERPQDEMQMVISFARPPPPTFSSVDHFLTRWTKLVAFVTVQCITPGGILNVERIDLAHAIELDQSTYTCSVPWVESEAVRARRCVCVVAVRHFRGTDPICTDAARAVHNELRRAWVAACQRKGDGPGPVVLSSLGDPNDETTVLILSQLSVETVFASTLERVRKKDEKEGEIPVPHTEGNMVSIERGGQSQKKPLYVSDSDSDASAYDPPSVPSPPSYQKKWNAVQQSVSRTHPDLDPTSSKRLVREEFIDALHSGESGRMNKDASSAVGTVEADVGAEKIKTSAGKEAGGETSEKVNTLRPQSVLCDANSPSARINEMKKRSSVKGGGTSNGAKLPSIEEGEANSNPNLKKKTLKSKSSRAPRAAAPRAARNYVPIAPAPTAVPIAPAPRSVRNYVPIAPRPLPKGLPTKPETGYVPIAPRPLPKGNTTKPEKSGYIPIAPLPVAPLSQPKQSPAKPEKDVSSKQLVPAGHLDQPSMLAATDKVSPPPTSGEGAAKKRRWNVTPTHPEGKGDAEDELKQKQTDPSQDEFQQVLSWIMEDANEETEEPIDLTMQPAVLPEPEPLAPKRRKVDDFMLGIDGMAVSVAQTFSWMPVLPNEFAHSASEYLGAGLLAIAAALFGYDDVGMKVVYTIVVCHTIITALTDIGPRTRYLRFPVAPISPWIHKYFDCLLVATQLTCIAIMPEHFGSTPHRAALFVMFAGGSDILLGLNSILYNFTHDEEERERQLELIRGQTHSRNKEKEM